MTEPITKNIVVFYHSYCQDGFSSAWVAWKKFGDRASYIAIQPTEPFEIPEGKEVYFVDNIPKDDILKNILSKNKSVQLIDHHVTNESIARMIPGSVFDNSKSAAVLTWEHFNPDERVPQLLQYVQDMDLWQWKLPNSKDICAYIVLEKMEFENWDRLVQECEHENSRNQFAEKGKLLNLFEAQKIEQIIRRNGQLVEFEGIKTLSVNSSIFHSMIGNELANKLPPMGIIWQESRDYIAVSLRSDGNIDVSALAKKYGGGGHKAAAGFRLPIGTPLPWKRIETNEK